MAHVSRHLDIYDTGLHLARTKREWASLKRKLKIPDQCPDSAGQATFATFHPNDGGITQPHLILWIDIKSHRTRAELVNTCAHEAAHAATSLLDHLGHQIKVSDEPHAYLVGWLTEWLWSECIDQLVIE